MSAHSLPDTCFGAYAMAKTSMTINTASPSARHRNDRERQTAKGVHANVATVTSAASHGMYGLEIERPLRRGPHDERDYEHYEDDTVNVHPRGDDAG